MQCNAMDVCMHACMHVCVCVYVCVRMHMYISSYIYNIHREIQCRMFRIWNHPFRGITRWHSLRSITIFCGVRLGQLLYLFSGQRFNDQINLKCSSAWSVQDFGLPHPPHVTNRVTSHFSHFRSLSAYVVYVVRITSNVFGGSAGSAQLPPGPSSKPSRPQC